MSSDRKAPPFQTALVGFGRIARDYVVALADLADFEIACVVDLDDEARAAAAELEVPLFVHAEEMLAERPVDVALVLTPPLTHEAITVRLLQAGCHVLCEKPLAIESEAAHHMLVAAQRAQRVLMMATKFRFVEDVVEARRLIAAGAIGTPVFYENSFCSVVDMTTRWNSNPEYSGGGVLIDNGSHSIDLARSLLGNIIKVFTTFGRRCQPVQVEDSVRINFEAFGGVMGVVELSWSIDKGGEHYATVTGSEGSVQLGWKSSRYRRYEDGEWHDFGSGYDKRRAFRRQLQHLASVLRGEEEPLVTREDMHDSVRFVDAAYRSAMVSRWVPILSHNRR